MKKKGIQEKTIQKKAGKKKDRRPGHLAARKKISQIVTWIGLIIIGILAVPTGILITLISALWSATDKIVYWIGKGKKS